MTLSTHLRHAVRFGNFELDTRAGELWNGSTKVPLQEQPLQILRMLLERPGELVTREELHSALWPGSSFGDFDDSLNHAVRRLRDVLGDLSAHPHFIETLPRHGYRFIAPLEAVAAGSPSREGGTARTPPLQRWVLVLAALTLIVLAGLGVYVVRQRLARPEKARAGKIMLVVLPFDNLSGDPEQEYFSDGMTEEMTAQLGQLSPQQLGVIGRASAMTYKGRKKTIDEIGKELRVQYVLEGSVRRQGDRVRVTAQLIEVGNQTHVWAQSYDRDVGSILWLQADVARAVAHEIQIKLTPQAQTSLASQRPVNPEAYRLYLIGRFLWNKRTEEGLKNAIDHFQRALEIDPGYGLAYAGLADSYLMLDDWGFLPPKEAIPRGKAAAQKALEIDESLAEAHASLALACFEYDWDWPACEREYRRAIELNPNYATAHQWYFAYLFAMGRHAEAMREIQRAQQLDPLSPIISGAVADQHFYARHYEEAIRRFRNTISLFPEFAPAYQALGAACVVNGTYQEAIVAYQKLRSLSGASAAEVAALGQAYAKGGIRGYYLWELRRLREESKHRYVRAWTFALLLAGLGEKDQALSYLEKAYEDRDYLLTTLQDEPRFDPLRSDPRFQDLLRRMNFPP